MSSRGAALSLALICSCQSPGKSVAGCAISSTCPSHTFSGFPTSKRIATFDGGIPWRTAEYEDPPAVADGSKQAVVQPAFANGDVAAYVITEIWDTHPDPWVQPIYHVEAARRCASRPCWASGVDSTFYSPYWRIYDVPGGSAQPGPVSSVQRPSLTRTSPRPKARSACAPSCLQT